MKKTGVIDISRHRLAHAVLHRAFKEGVEVKTLAKKTRLNEGTIYRLRSGKTRFPRFQTLVLLAEAVGLSLKWIDAAEETKPIEQQLTVHH